MATHFLVYDEPGRDTITYELNAAGTGYFEVGTQANAVVAALSKSLPYLRKLGVENIEANRQPMLQRLHKEMPRLGFEPLTPADSKSALITFAVKDVEPYADRLKPANVTVRLGRHFIRLSPSVFNDMAENERVFEALWKH